ncbi:MAG: hypothetical protein ACI9SG_000458 [Maribacter sp.]
MALAYVKRDALSKSMYEGATEMAKGVRDLPKIKQQLDFILEISEDESINSKGSALNESIDGWIAKILQKEMRTYQRNYMFEARLLIKFKDFLNSIGKGNLRVTRGTRDVTKDYLKQWVILKSSLEDIKTKEVTSYNELVKEAGLPLLYWA